MVSFKLLISTKIVVNVSPSKSRECNWIQGSAYGTDLPPHCEKTLGRTHAICPKHNPP
jgi:hypothetical protein